MAAEVTGITQYQVAPGLDCKVATFAYTKANAGDTFDTGSYGFKTILFVHAKKSSDGVLDPCTWATDTITFTAGTAGGIALVVGTC